MTETATCLDSKTWSREETGRRKRRRKKEAERGEIINEKRKSEEDAETRISKLAVMNCNPEVIYQDQGFNPNLTDAGGK